jgi:enoyl-CoA hydratase/carnithine racemase
VVPDAALEREARSLISSLTEASASALALTKQLFYQLDGRSLEDGIALGARVNAAARQTPDFRSAIARFLER